MFLNHNDKTHPMRAHVFLINYGFADQAFANAVNNTRASARRPSLEECLKMHLSCCHTLDAALSWMKSTLISHLSSWKYVTCMTDPSLFFWGQNLKIWLFVLNNLNDYKRPKKEFQGPDMISWQALLGSNLCTGKNLSISNQTKLNSCMPNQSWAHLF